MCMWPSTTKNKPPRIERIERIVDLPVVCFEYCVFIRTAHVFEKMSYLDTDHV
jgi:hypothetical protein